ncbi:uncharacterized protein EI97DRAFT_431430 [Westerdykella ornata]|uniref:Uncharacterized protein n=1 Tax=Westerdykella ornata TaxID=318751 RepID=A0A6A6JT41_WESOR|nr:uncharacterized protein EI97DRAFT_431430 [Westerdykella ornata]KAF2278159.1 hypothetical protein EI97DRAFT_431430 [Westerdykella ornata]
MADPYPPSRAYQAQYRAAQDLFDQEEYEKCIAEVRKNLSDQSLPPYYVIKNCMLIACAQDDWSEGEAWRLAAENAFRRCVESSVRRNDNEALEILGKLRNELDKLPGILEANTTGADTDMEDGDDGMGFDEEAEAEFQDAEDEDAICFEDPKEVAEAENELERRAEIQAKEKLEHEKLENAADSVPNEAVPTASGHKELRKMPSSRYLPSHFIGGQRRALSKKRSFIHRKDPESKQN